MGVTAIRGALGLFYVTSVGTGSCISPCIRLAASCTSSAPDTEKYTTVTQHMVASERNVLTVKGWWSLGAFWWCT